MAKSGLVVTTIVGLLIAFVPLWNIEGPELVNKILNSKNNQGVIDTTALRLFGNGTFVLALIPLVFWIRKLVRNPLKINLIRHVNTPRYDQYVAFVESFYEDLERIVDTYAKGRTVFVFVDDLDRCDIPKAADLMKAFNLMISDDSNLVFIIGMDRAKVAAGIAVKYEELLPYIYVDKGGYSREDANKVDAASGLEFGYEFIEKFIQIPFSVPRPTADEFDNYVQVISTVKRYKSSDQASRRNWRFLRIGARRLWWKLRFGEAHLIATTGTVMQDTSSSTSSSYNQQEPSYDTYSLRIAEDFETIGTIAQHLASALDYNPRRLKQFINLFRLRVLIAAETGLLQEMADIPAITPEQIGKLVAISLKWPLLVNDLIRDPSLLSRLQQVAFDTEATSQEKSIGGPNDPSTPQVETFNRWIRRPALMDLLRIGLSGEMPNPAYDLQNVNLEKLSRVAPQVEYFDTFDPIGRRADPGVELGVPDSITIVPIVEYDAIPLVEDGESPLSLALSPSYAVPNQTIVVTGRGFTNGGYAGINDTNDASSVVIDDDPTGLKAANVVSATSKINEGRKITIDGGGSWSSTIVLPINDTMRSPGTHDLKITDNSGREGVGRLIIAPLTLSLDTSED